MLIMACCLAHILLLSALAASAQGFDLSGEWHLHKRKSVPDNVDGRRVPTKLVVEQDQNKLVIDRTYDGFFVYEDFVVGGKASASKFRDNPRTATATWSADGKGLTIAATVVFRWRGNEVEVSSTEVWHLGEEGEVLTIHYSSENRRGQFEATLVYNKEKEEAIIGEREFIPPNYNFYFLPKPKAKPLGWAQERIEEKLGRGMLAIPNEAGQIYLGWRLRKDDPADIAFNLYRSTDGGDPVQLNKSPIEQTTDFVDTNPPLDRQNAWWVRAVINGEEQEASSPAALPANPPQQQYLSFKLRDDLPEGGIHKIGIGDLDGDGEYDFVIKRPGGRVDPGRARRSPDTFKVEGYKRDGTWLWRNDLGWSIEQGTWTSPMIVYDFNGDGKAEVALKTSEGDHREENGRVLSGPEYCSVFNGETGAEIARVDWIARGKPSDWGDDVGNRMNRNMLGVAYLDGKTPSLLVVRGIYGLMKMDAWFMRDNQLHKAWSWSNESAGWKYQGQGQHNIHVADIDGDGYDEILNGSLAIDHNGQIMWSTGMGHGDRFYVSDIDPHRPGMEVWYSYEDPHPQNGVGLWDAHSGNLIFGTDQAIVDNEIDRALVSDIDPAYPGMECWADRFFYTAKGEPIPGDPPPLNGLVWWDADPLRELQTRDGISKWKGPVLTSGIEGNTMVWADLLGDWREEIVTYIDGEIRIYTTTIPATDRRVCLMQDPLYRIDVALKASGYDQVPMTSYFLGSN